MDYAMPEIELIRLLYVEDDEVDYLGFKRFLREEKLPYEHVRADSVTQGREVLARDTFHVVLMDFMLGDGTAFDLFEHVPETVPIIIATGSGDEEVAVQAMKAGASDYLIKDPAGHWLKTLPITVHNAIKARRAEEALARAHAELELKVLERTAELQATNEELQREIEQRKSVEDALRRSEERFRALTESVGEWIWETDSRGTFTYVSPRVHDVLGHQPSDLVAKTIFDLMSPDEARRVAKKFAAIVESRKPFRDLENLSKHRDGRLILMETSGHPFFDEMGRLVGYRGTGRDISDRKNAERLSIQSERLKAVTELAAGVAHNFNNLLQIVLSDSETALSLVASEDKSDVKAIVERIVETCQFGANTVKRLQYFADAESAAGRQGSVFCLSRTVEKAIEMSRPWWKTIPEKEGITIAVTSNLKSDCPIQGEENELLEVVMNLVKNSVEAMPAGGEIVLNTSVDQEQAFLVVRDNGMGIPADVLPKVFQPFFTTKGVEGTGIGLASSYGIIRRHGGAISVESALGRGTTFTVRLPLAPQVKISGPASGLAAKQPGKERALLIDDEKILVKALRTLLSLDGHTVFSARSGEEGLEVFEREAPTVVITDLGMPSMNGWQVAKAIKERSERKGVPRPIVIVLTGWAAEADTAVKMKECGVDAFLQKPVRFSALRQKLREVLENREKSLA
ncbi:MAG: response regulator [Thermodesulfobacteriota bacterium]